MILNKQQKPRVNPSRDQQQRNRTKSDFARPAAQFFFSKREGSVATFGQPRELRHLIFCCVINRDFTRRGVIDRSAIKFLNHNLKVYPPTSRSRTRDPSRRTRVPEEKLGDAIKTRASPTGDELSMTRLLPQRPWHHRDGALGGERLPTRE